MTPALRRVTFTIHITSSVGWVGAVMAFLALAVIGFASNDDVKVRGAYLLMAPAAWFGLVRWRMHRYSAESPCRLARRGARFATALASCCRSRPFNCQLVRRSQVRHLGSNRILPDSYVK